MKMRQILGYARSGKPIFAIMGGSGDGPAPDPQQQPQPNQGDTITVQEGDQPRPSTEQPPATPAPTSAVDPGAFSRGTAEHQPQQHQTPPGQQPVAGQTTNPETGRTFTVEEVEAFRRQERDKLYPEIQSLKDELRAEREAREEEQRKRAEEEARAAEAAREAEEGELDVRELIRRKEKEWEERFTEVQAEAEKSQAMLEQERQFNALQEYKRQKLEAHEDDIMPHLRGYVSGSSEEEIDASIQQQIETTAAILADVQQAQQAQRQQVPTTRVTAPGDGGPIEQTQTGQRTFSAEDIRNMTPAEYAKYRDQLLGAAARQGPYAR